MSFTRTHVRTQLEAGQTPVTYEHDVSFTRKSDVSESIPDGSTDMIVLWNVDISALVSLIIGSDQDLTIETNNPGGASAAPDDTLALKADQAVDWCEDDVMTCPITADVTILYVTNASGSTATLEIRAGMDATP